MIYFDLTQAPIIIRLNDCSLPVLIHPCSEVCGTWEGCVSLCCKNKKSTGLCCCRKEGTGVAAEDFFFFHILKKNPSAYS